MIGFVFGIVLASIGWYIAMTRTVNIAHRKWCEKMNVLSVENRKLREQLNCTLFVHSAKV